MKRAYSPEEGTRHSICSEKCAELIFLDFEEVVEAVIYPRSCEHCFRCGRLVGGTFENGCVVHFERHNPRGLYCPISDLTRTLQFEYSMTLVVLRTSDPLSDELWDYAAAFIGLNKDVNPEALADLLVNSPELYE